MNKHLSKQELYKVVCYTPQITQAIWSKLELKLEIKNRQNGRAEAKTEVHQMKTLTGEILSVIEYAASRIPLMPWS